MEKNTAGEEKTWLVDKININNTGKSVWEKQVVNG